MKPIVFKYVCPWGKLQTTLYLLMGTRVMVEFWQVIICHHYTWWLTPLTHWGRVTHICVGKLTIIGSDNGLSPGRRQAIIWTNAGILLIEPLGTNFSEILIGIQICSFKKMRLKMSSAKWRPFCLGLNVLMCGPCTLIYKIGTWRVRIYVRYG